MFNKERNSRCVVSRVTVNKTDQRRFVLNEIQTYKDCLILLSALIVQIVKKRNNYSFPLRKEQNANNVALSQNCGNCS